MPNNNDQVAAEIMTAQGQEQNAALLLQRAGFQILHIGVTISVSAPAEVWTRVFDVSFAPAEREVAPGRRVQFQKPSSEDLEIPAALAEVVTRVFFAEPPDLH